MLFSLRKYNYLLCISFLSFQPPAIRGRPSYLRNDLNSTCLTIWSWLKRKHHALYKRNCKSVTGKVVDVCQFANDYKTISKKLGPQQTTMIAISHKWSMEEWCSFPGVTSLPKLLREFIED
ncbi:hypothetical protein AMECASPLE_028095 [Ameca splendens]|uniref:Uncharacterized protein n=1 Tax=Ameca splendens TaxID=208324 RepID=A0ABV0Y5K7_9TELE